MVRPAGRRQTANKGGDGGWWWWWWVVVMAVAKRRIVGWAILRKQEPDLSLAAFEWGGGRSGDDGGWAVGLKVPNI